MLGWRVPTPEVRVNIWLLPGHSPAEVAVSLLPSTPFLHRTKFCFERLRFSRDSLLVLGRCFSEARGGDVNECGLTTERRKPSQHLEDPHGLRKQCCAVGRQVRGGTDPSVGQGLDGTVSLMVAEGGSSLMRFQTPHCSFILEKPLLVGIRCCVKENYLQLSKKLLKYSFLF